MMLKKIKAGALQFTMFVVVLIALLLAAFVILVTTHKQFNLQTDIVLQTIQNANSGIDYLIQNEIKLQDTVAINLQNYEDGELKVYRNYWGVFEKGLAISKIKNKEFIKIALLGGSQPEKERVALYLEDLNKPLVVVGNTSIEGLAYLPKAGVRTGNISGHSYHGEKLIYGDTKLSGSLPKIQEGVLENIKAINNINKNLTEEQFLNLDKGKIFINSFFDPLQVVYSRAEILLSQMSLTGHILVQSDTKITVDASSRLTDIILIAPKVELKEGVTGNFQGLASKEITLGKDCVLGYPSALILKDTESQRVEPGNILETPFIKINEGSHVKGIVAYLGKTESFKPQIEIHENATIVGEVYCDKNIELTGTVYGSVFTSGFVSIQSASMYQNHIYNGQIAVNDLPQEYVGLTFKESKKGIAKWLY